MTRYVATWVLLLQSQAYSVNLKTQTFLSTADREQRCTQKAVILKIYGIVCHYRFHTVLGKFTSKVDSSIGNNSRWKQTVPTSQHHGILLGWLSHFHNNIKFYYLFIPYLCGTNIHRTTNRLWPRAQDTRANWVAGSSQGPFVQRLNKHDSIFLDCWRVELSIRQRYTKYWCRKNYLQSQNKVEAS